MARKEEDIISRLEEKEVLRGGDEDPDSPARQSRWNGPWASLLLLLVFLGCYLLLSLRADNNADRAVFLLLIGGAKVNALIAQGQWWRLISSAFLHGTFTHLAVNSIGILLLGWFVENSYNRGLLWFSFICSAAVGSGLSLVMTSSASVGASGGMFGLLGMTVAYATFNWSRVPRFIRVYVVLLPAVVGGVSIGHGLISENVDNSAHFGGLVAGLSIGLATTLGEHLPDILKSVCRVFLGASVALATLFSLGTTVSHLMMRFELEHSRLSAVDRGPGPAHFAPSEWEQGVFAEGTCLLGREVQSEKDIACYVDPFFSMLLVGPDRRLKATGVWAEITRRLDGEEPELFPEYEIFRASDTTRRRAFVLLSFAPLANDYLPLFSAVQALPARPGTP